jgi:hypothetical protein
MKQPGIPRDEFVKVQQDIVESTKGQEKEIVVKELREWMEKIGNYNTPDLERAWQQREFVTTFEEEKEGPNGEMIPARGDKEEKEKFEIAAEVKLKELQESGFDRNLLEELRQVENEGKEFDKEKLESLEKQEAEFEDFVNKYIAERFTFKDDKIVEKSKEIEASIQKTFQGQDEIATGELGELAKQFYDMCPAADGWQL